MTDQRPRLLPRSTVRRDITARTATPEGGARSWKQQWVRGCVAAALLAAPVSAQQVPSGQSVTLSEVLIDTVGKDQWARFRFLTPQIARADGDVSYGDAEPDFAHLCETVARPYLAEFDLQADVIAISFMDRPVVFGEVDPEATQFFEVFRIKDHQCVWEAF